MVSSHIQLLNAKWAADVHNQVGKGGCFPNLMSALGTLNKGMITFTRDSATFLGFGSGIAKTKAICSRSLLVSFLGIGLPVSVNDDVYLCACGLEMVMTTDRRECFYQISKGFYPRWLSNCLN